jgi:hypothetical protein
MSSTFTTPTLDEAKRWVTGVQHEGYSTEDIQRKGRKYLCKTAWGGKAYQRFLSRFKAQAVVRSAAESKSMMESGKLL